MLRLMFLGDRIIGGPSAYSKVGYETCTRLAKLGHHVAHIPMGRANKMGKQGLGDVLIYPSGNDYFCEDVAVQHYVDFKADMLITVKEPWVFNNIFKWAINFTPMAVIDHSPVSAAITARLTSAFKVIAISRFGQAELKRASIESEYIPHGIRCDLYKPFSQEEKIKCRKLFYLPEDEFIVGYVGMNRVRKMIGRALRGYKRFRELNPDVKSHMMLWTNVQPRAPPEDITVGVSDVGVNLLPEIFGLGLGEAVRWAKWDDIEKIGGIPDYDPTGGWDMVKLYNCFDALLLCSNEGVGLPLLESQACGVMPVTMNIAAGPEHVGAGLTVRASDYDILNTPGVRYYFADIDGIAEALTKILNMDREKAAGKTRRFAEKFDWNVVVEQYWKPFLESCEEELYPLVTKGGLKKWG